jgi:type VI secretion system secreted protein Hcp
MAYDAFIKLTGITGGSQATGKADHCDIYSFSWGASNPTTVGTESGLGAGKVSLSSFNFMKQTDRASPDLFKFCCTGQHIAEVVVSLRKSGGKNPLDYITYTFKECMVESVQWSGSSGGDDTPTESISVAFTSVKIMYQPQKADGAKDGGEKTASWNVKKNAETPA